MDMMRGIMGVIRGIVNSFQGMFYFKRKPSYLTK